MKTFSFYHKETGALHQGVFTTDDLTQLSRNIPPDHAPIEGVHDHLSRRVDIAQVAALRAAHTAAHQATVKQFRDRYDARGGLDAMGKPVEFREPPEPPFTTPLHVVVDHVPDQPSADHEWDATTKRWEVKAEVQAKQRARAAALAEIARLEHEEQPAILRDMALGKPGAVNRLRALDERIAALRSAWQGVELNGY